VALASNLLLIADDMYVSVCPLRPPLCTSRDTDMDLTGAPKHQHAAVSGQSGCWPWSPKKRPASLHKDDEELTGI